MKTLIFAISLAILVTLPASAKDKKGVKSPITIQAYCWTSEGRRICCNENSCWEILF